MREPKLGLCNPPQRRYLFIGQNEGDSGACWYELNANKQKIYVTEHAVAGYLTGIRLKEHDMGRHGMKWKVDFFIDAGEEQFAIRAGADTVFIRGLILALTRLVADDNTNLKDVLTFAVSPSKEQSKIVFGTVYHHGGRVKYEWEKDAPLVPLIRHLQEFVGSGGESDESGEGAEEPSDDHDHSTAPRVQSAQPQRPAGLANADVLKELKRVGASVGYTLDGEQAVLDIDQLNAECRRHFPYCQTIEDLKIGDAIEFRKTLMSA